jgi:hypothetical protein
MTTSLSLALVALTFLVCVSAAFLCLWQQNECAGWFIDGVSSRVGIEKFATLRVDNWRLRGWDWWYTMFLVIKRSLEIAPLVNRVGWS